MKKKIDYKASGVDIEKGDLFVEKIKRMVGSTYNCHVASGVGGFASLYEISPDRYLSAGTDGVGTKLKIAQLLGKHDTIGIDLVAMCVNDILCTGSRPLFFLDYYATYKLDLAVSEEIIKGIVEGCRQGKLALIGGETAEMPGIYQEGDYDLAGFAVGEVEKSRLIDGSKIKSGDQIIGLASSGFHSNGFSLIRKLVDPSERELLEMCLQPTRIYVSLIHYLIEKYEDSIKGLAHITGGGFHNIPRISGKWNYNIAKVPHLDDIAPVIRKVTERADMGFDDLYGTFNMGVGLVMVTDRGDEIMGHLSKMGEKAWHLGEISNGDGKLVFKNK
ncbi:MAG: phosphoribosylformylglycinamidine cyclo-ligase [Oligoflexales bacterium]|nr:phosphoribosylformylglycinamidine cyclo-ligase [Oligoflexales bacterium]